MALPVTKNCEDQLSNEEIHDQNQYRSSDHGLGGRAAHPLGAATRGYAVVAANGRDDEPKQHGLDQAGEDIAEDKYLPDRGPILLSVEPEQQMRDPIAADQPKQVGDDSEEKQHEDGGPHSWRNQLLSGIGAQGAHGIDLFGHDHRTEFAGHAGGVPPGHHQSGDERAQFGDHAERHELADERDSAESLQGAG